MICKVTDIWTTENASIKAHSSNITRKKGRLDERHLHYSARSTVGFIRGSETVKRKRENNRGGFKIVVSTHAYHLSHSNPGAKSVTLINRPVRNTNQYCTGTINSLCSQSSLQRWNWNWLRLPFVGYLWPSVRWRRVTKCHLCRYQESVGLLWGGELQQWSVVNGFTLKNWWLKTAMKLRTKMSLCTIRADTV